MSNNVLKSEMENTQSSVEESKDQSRLNSIQERHDSKEFKLKQVPTWLAKKIQEVAENKDMDITILQSNKISTEEFDAAKLYLGRMGLPFKIDNGIKLLSLKPSLDKTIQRSFSDKETELFVTERFDYFYNKMLKLFIDSNESNYMAYKKEHGSLHPFAKEKKEDQRSEYEKEILEKELIILDNIVSISTTYVGLAYLNKIYNTPFIGTKSLMVKIVMETLLKDFGFDIIVEEAGLIEVFEKDDLEEALNTPSWYFSLRSGNITPKTKVNVNYDLGISKDLQNRFKKEMNQIVNCPKSRLTDVKNIKPEKLILESFISESCHVLSPTNLLYTPKPKHNFSIIELFRPIMSKSLIFILLIIICFSIGIKGCKSGLDSTTDLLQTNFEVPMNK